MRLFADMKESGVVPRAADFNVLLRCLGCLPSAQGSAIKIKGIIDMMRSYDVKPNEETFEVVKLLVERRSKEAELEKGQITIAATSGDVEV